MAEDYAPLIANDPFYLQTQALYNSQSAADAARLQEQLQNLIIDFGEVPSGYTSPYLTPTAAALAAQNTQAGLSLLARLNRQTEDARRTQINDLAARGILSSGETGFQLGRVQQGSLESQYDARRALLDLLRQGSDTFAQAELQRKLGLLDAAQNAYARQQARAANLQVGGGGVGYGGEGGVVGGGGLGWPGEDEQGGGVGGPGGGSTAGNPRNQTPQMVAEQGIRWGGQTFTDAASFQRWLRQHGGSWSAWSSKYPGQAASLMGRP